LASKIFKVYKYRFYPRLKEYRGFTRLLKILDGLAHRSIENYDSADEAQSIFEKDWDNLIIIDACRYDLYQEVVGEGDYRVTLASCSKEFFDKTFSDRDSKDTVYISANPHIDDSIFEPLTGKSSDDVFHSVYRTYRTDWDDEKGTVLPEPVLRDAKTAEKLNPDKKKIIHLMQPHYPFITEKSSMQGGFSPELDSKQDKEETPWNMAEKGEMSRGKVWKGFKENLEYVLPFVEELNQELEGKTVVTADHGNLVGENGCYGHPCGSNAKGLRKVPWHELD